MNSDRIDLDALMAQVRERIREKREKGIYGSDVEALLRVPLPGGRRIFSDMRASASDTASSPSTRMPSAETKGWSALAISARV